MVLARLPPRVPSHHTGQSVWAFLAHLVFVAARPLGFAAGAAAFAAGALASERRSARRGGLARGLARGPLLREEPPSCGLSPSPCMVPPSMVAHMSAVDHAPRNASETLVLPPLVLE